MSEEECFYTLFNVERDATEKEIQSGYRRLAAKIHPDKHVTETEEEQAKVSEVFKKVQSAMERLTDPVERYKYDRFGVFDLDKNDMDYKLFSPVDLNSIYHDHFIQPSRPKELPPPHPCKFTLSELYHGREKNIKLHRDVLMNGVLVREHTKVHFCCKIPPGCRAGTVFTLHGASNETRPGCFANARIVVEELEHELFSRDGDELSCTLAVSAKEGILGFTRVIKSLNGDDVVVTANDVSTTGREFRFSGYGMPKKEGGFGDLVVLLLVDELTDEQKEIWAKMF